VLGVLQSNGTPSGKLGQYLFQVMSSVCFLYCILVGARTTADCLSEEKREGTLGLLFLTELKGYDVVFGKLAATSLNGFYCLLAMFPVLAVPLIMGGITNGEFWRTVLVLVNIFLFSLAIGILASVLSWNLRGAMGANFLLLLLLAGALPACAGAIAYFSPSHRVVPELLYSCPVYSFYLSSDAFYRWAIRHFWWSTGVVHALTWLLVALASWLVPRSWQDRPSGDGQARWRDRWRVWVYGVWVYGDAARRKAFRTRLLNVNAFYWLAARAWFKPAGVWLSLGFVACWWLYMPVILHFNWFDEFFILYTALILNSLLKLWIAVEAGQRLAEDQKMGALELLLSTPLSVRDILRGQWLALRRQFLRPLLVVIAAELLLILAVPSQSDLTVLSFGMAGILLLVIDLVALTWVAMATALTARSPNHASVSTIFRVLILPWVVCGAVGVMVNLWFATRGAPAPEWKFYLGLWFWSGIVADLAFGLPAWWQLRTRFRHLAQQRFTSAPARLAK
jgi:ABC-type transport system involved in multi-copper enzyme maturation permease subunit